MHPAQPHADGPHHCINHRRRPRRQEIAYEQLDRRPAIGITLQLGVAGGAADGEPVQIGEVGLVIVEQDGFDAHVTQGFDERPAHAYEVGEFAEEVRVRRFAVGGLDGLMRLHAEEVEEDGGVGGVE